MLKKATPLEWLEKRQNVGMSEMSELMLNLLALKGPMTVMDTILHGKDRNAGSITALHGAVMWLRRNDFVKVQANTSNMSKKLCMLTKKGERYIGKKDD